ncbi:FK506-binding protein-like isoform X1 [Sus scrofa]|uniref:FK506-binding protein-like n=3 Tax=Sus scrofa TaxID=9823 RepID=A0A8D0QAD2_PIG|nr:FK506-binding protein-like [Sus scrofa]XP_005665882.1 FK506-binding protein-like isoform X1 [Sus scrofa]XP_013833108.1 FK506-binding protein-like isoform X1 [Sus scrofa]XP_020953701.1 FK506-binding protein-like isoform X1 [Sus scrofa]ABX82830.1 FK506-binding protein [Sus scrofa]CAN13311.1 FK506 binding protein like [Sus scrofa]CAN59655.1 FK506 binding protein like [Sus scrofa]
METPPVSPLGEKNISQPQQRWKKNSQKILDSTTQIRQQPQDPSTELLEGRVSPDPAGQILENLQEIEKLAVGREGDSDKSHGPASEMPEPLQASELWYCPDGSFVKKILIHGHGLDKPKLGSRCRVQVLGFPLGSGLPEGWTELTMGLGPWREETWGELVEKCLESMCQGEEAELQLPGRSGPPVRLKLASFTQGRDSWELEPTEKEALAREERARGTELFRAGNPEGAARCYGRALRLLLTLPPPGSPERTVLHANLAACQLLLGQPHLAAQSCDRVLEREPGHLKALYRRGVAQAALGNLDKATADLKKVLAVDPKNRAAQEELGKVIIQGKKQDAGLAQGLRKMFG